MGGSKHHFMDKNFGVLPNFLETTGHNVAMEGNIAKTAFESLFAQYFAEFHCLKSVSMT